MVIAATPGVGSFSYVAPVTVSYFSAGANTTEAYAGVGQFINSNVTTVNPALQTASVGVANHVIGGNAMLRDNILTIQSSLWQDSILSIQSSVIQPSGVGNNVDGYS